jgi:proline dehydrogenase
MSLANRLIANALPVVPKPIIGHFSQRYIAGPSLEDAVRVVRGLNESGVMATVDVLGEHLTRIEEADAALASYLELLDRITAEKLDSNISVKLSALGLKVDPAVCLRHMQRLCTVARERHNFVRIDMEDSSCTAATLEIHAALRRDFSNVGAVIQAYMRRSEEDVRALVADRANVRLCKGIYVEPRAIAYRDREIVRQNFVALLQTLLGGGSYVGIATHDEILVWHALRMVRELGLAREQYEFQMLLGVDDELRRILVGAGHRLRVYVPFGAHWYAYSMRRLKENPDIVGHIIRSALRG